MNAFTRRQKSVWKTAIAVPATLLIGLGGTALMAAPALADTAPAATATSTSTASSADAATTPTSAPSAPTATATAPATAPATPAPSVTHAVTPKPAARAAAAAAAPTTLTVTSPIPQDPNSDFPTPDQLTSRTFDITGTAPVGAHLEVDDIYGTKLATLTTTTATFSIPVTIAADAAYEQGLDVYGTAGRAYLDDVFLYLEFPAATAVAPVLDTPATTSFTVAPLPLGFGTFGNPVTVTGTGTPGDNVELFSTRVGTTPDTSDDPDDPFGDGTQTDLITVGTDGTWTGYAYFDYGTTDLWAAQQQFYVDAQTTAAYGEAVTHTSPFAGPQAITLTEPAGTVDAPEITKPAYDDGTYIGGSSTSGSIGLGVGRTKSSGATTGAASHSAASASADTASPATASTARADRDHALAASLPTAREPFVNLTPEALAAASGDTVRARAKADSTSSSSDSVDSEIAQDGIQVKGTPSTTRHGYLTTTVSGTGTPGDHVVVYAEDGDTASAYVDALYPQLFQELTAYLTELNDSDGTTPIVPPTITTNTVTSLLPADDGSITVAADGTWTTTVTLKPGSYGVMAFAVDPSTKVYSAGSELLGVHLTGTPILDPASTSTSELAFTGSQHSVAIGIGGLAAIAAGGALLVIARRRRQEV